MDAHSSGGAWLPRVTTPRFLRPGRLTGSGSAKDWRVLALRRLAFVASLGVGLGLVGCALMLLRQPNVGELRAAWTRPWWPAPLFVLCSGVVLASTGVSRWSRDARLDIGLVWLVGVSFLAGLFRHGLPYDAADVVRGVSPVAVGVIVYAVIVPTRPARMGLAATLAAAADPLALLLLVALGHPNPPPNLWLWLHVGDVVGIGLAVLTSRNLFALNVEVEQARDAGAYELVERIGRGGMGEVWVARHRRLARPVAVKLVLPSMLDRSETYSAQAIARFEREARATAALGSPNVVRVFDFGTTDEGAFYYAMELLDGVDLHTLVEREGPQPPARVRHLLVQACDALADAHAHDLVHRDIKPANLMACRVGQRRDVVKVLDFGIALAGGDEAEARLTGLGGLIGSPLTLAPEVALGRQATPASDLYGLGCVAFWLLTGRDVFRCDTVAAYLQAHAREPAPSPSEALGRPLPADLEALVVSLLEKDPERRPASAAALAQALAALDLPPWPDDVDPQTFPARAHEPEGDRVAHAAGAQTWDGGGP